MDAWRLLHMLALFWMMIGIGAVIVPIWSAWRTADLEVRAVMLSEAQQAETRWLLPGLLGTGVTGFALAASVDINVLTTGWLLALLILFAADIFVFLPLMGVGLRRVRLFALQAKKHGAVTDDLQGALDDNVPLVFGTLMVLTVPVMVWLSVFQPF